MYEAGNGTLPPGQRYIIKRPRLTRLLDESKARILMLIAAAGYGKTTLARQWLEDRNHGWYRGVPASADVAALAVGVAEAASAIVPGAGKRMRERLRVTPNPERDVQALAELLAEDLAEWPAGAWLAFDDYHFAAQSAASEEFVGLVTSLSPIQLLLMSRRRPNWATPRRILYGELHELTTADLAMTQDETSAVLVDRGAPDESGLAALAAGWPAVIGLAALTTDAAVPQGELPEALYDYFAEELYEAATADLQEALSQLSLVLSVTREIARFLFGADSQAVLTAAVNLGFLLRTSKDTFELHPLLQRYLESKLYERPEREVAEITDRLAQFFGERELWDDFFLLIERTSSVPLLLHLIELAVPTMVRDGRLPTIAQWVDFAHARRIDSPLVDLAEAETALCQGDRKRSELLALRAAQSLGDDHPLVSRALWLAGMSALYEPSVATERHHQAHALAIDSESRFRALWGEIVSALHNEDRQAPRLLDELEKIEYQSADVQLRVVAGRLMYALQSGHISPVIDGAEAALALLDRSQDPLARSALLNTVASILALAGRYEEGRVVAKRELQEALDYRLSFVVPHACLNQAAAELGLRRFATCQALLEHALGTVHKTDGFIPVHAAAIALRLTLARGDISGASVLTRPPRPQRSTPGMEGEFLATRALALACSGDFSRALRDAATGRSLTTRPEPHVLSACVSAIIELRKGAATSPRTAADAFAAAVETGNVDSFVASYRAWPPLLQAVAAALDDLTDRALLGDIVRASRDHQLARRLGLTLPPSTLQRSSLSKREAEVLHLIAQGLTNHQIATALFITQTTVKVHVRHIFEKLGVKSRTEAALRAAADEDD